VGGGGGAVDRKFHASRRYLEKGPWRGEKKAEPFAGKNGPVFSPTDAPTYPAGRMRPASQNDLAGGQKLATDRNYTNSPTLGRVVKAQLMLTPEQRAAQRGRGPRQGIAGEIQSMATARVEGVFHPSSRGVRAEKKTC